MNLLLEGGSVLLDLAPLVLPVALILLRRAARRDAAMKTPSLSQDSYMKMLLLLVIPSLSFAQLVPVSEAQGEAAATKAPRTTGKSKKKKSLSSAANAARQNAAKAAQAAVEGRVLARPAKKDTAGHAIEYELTDESARDVYKVRTAISLSVTLEFPEPMTTDPVCADCVVAGKENPNALFNIVGKKGENRVVLKPNAFPQDLNVSEKDFRTTLNIYLKSFTLVIRVEYTSDPNAVTDLVRWVTPQRASESKFVADTLKQETERLQAEFAAKVKEEAKKEWLRQFIEPHRCRSAAKDERIERRDHVVLTLKETCRYGDTILARFSVENRSQIPFLMGKPGIGPTTKKDDDFQPLPTDSITSSPETTLDFGKPIEVVVTATSRESPSFTLRVPELREAEGRTLFIRDIAF